MTSKHEAQLAYVLHTRPYRETSLLVEALSLQHGRISLVARGAKRGSAPSSRLLQPFAPLSIAWFGNGELVTLTAVDACEPAHILIGKSAICGLYINELMVRLIPKWDPCAQLFAHYQNALTKLADGEAVQQVVLRKFELQLLRSLGYGLQLTTEIVTGHPVEADQYYIFDPALGPKLSARHNIAGIKGASLLALSTEQLDNPAILLDLKRLMRAVFSHHLGPRQLVTRELL